MNSECPQRNTPRTVVYVFVLQTNKRRQHIRLAPSWDASGGAEPGSL